MRDSFFDVRRGNARIVVFAALAGAAWCGPVGAQPQPPAEESAPQSAYQEPAPAPVDFATEIQPILAMHCIGCHGPKKRSGGLRLDAFSYIAAGGDSAKPIVGGTLETNELYARVSSSERTYRMPKNAGPLPDEDVARIRRWVEEGAKWSEASRGPAEAAKQPFYERWLSSAGKLADRYQAEYTYALSYIYALLAVQVLLLVIARCKVAYHSQRRWATGKAARVCRFCSEVRSRELGLVWLLTFSAVALAFMRGHAQKVESALAKSEQFRARAESPWARTIYGSPPVPVRPDHPKQIAGTYYRGNCERNPELFNNGNYLTAVFHIDLCDAQHRTLQLGDPPPAGGVWVRVELERAPGTADVLFSKELMASVFLSQTFYDNIFQTLQEPPVRLETVQEAQRWVAYFPIGSPDSSGKVAGLIYVYTGRIENDMARGDPHYGIKYDLVFADDKLTADSDLWMNSFGNSVVALPEPAGKIPFREWFDFRPIPPITGTNTKDPKLLGIEEYVRKGLIKPENVPQPAAAPAEPQDEE
jgi:mono/diheme cytochrome c family protein